MVDPNPPVYGTDHWHDSFMRKSIDRKKFSEGYERIFGKRKGLPAGGRKGSSSVGEEGVVRRETDRGGAGSGGVEEDGA